ncbi:hypothetical protein RT717_03705 [Imperialibacter roseus]|uniref:Uncharacterized protein n=1 Tax=Imperialibacter roseus TaxID=1324217 RepID=A0ABZ0IRN9_9BACT|nr:hypothetical protein [Imperialibacter roseus]WOK07728.1 hypothetical protein RT717_03705 [Imperialibacter roseus]
MTSLRPQHPPLCFSPTPLAHEPLTLAIHARTASAPTVNSQSARPLDNCNPRTAVLLMALPDNEKGYNTGV